MLSIYLEQHFSEAKKTSVGEENFTNEEYKKLFEWTDKNKTIAQFEGIFKNTEMF